MAPVQFMRPPEPGGGKFDMPAEVTYKITDIEGEGMPAFTCVEPELSSHRPSCPALPARIGQCAPMFALLIGTHLAVAGMVPRFVVRSVFLGERLARSQ